MNVLTTPDQTIDEVNRITKAAREALTDQMIERIAVTGGVVLELVDRLNDEQTNAAVHRLIDRLAEMHKIGALDTACDLILMAHGTRNALTDSMIERLFSFFENFLNTIGQEEVCNLVDSTCHALIDAAAETAKTPARGGLLSAVAMLSKPETQQSLRFLMRFAGKLQDHSNAC